MHPSSKFFDLKAGEVNFHFDCEFIEDPAHGTAFISIGAVIESITKTEHFYAINKDFYQHPAFYALIGSKNEEWMRDNVFKHINASIKKLGLDTEASDPAPMNSIWQEIKNSSIGHEKSATQLVISGKDQPKVFSGQMVVGNKAFIKAKLLEAVASSTKAKVKSVRPWAYYSTTDMQMLFEIFGGYMSMPDEWNHYAYDLRAVTDVLMLPHDKFNPEGPHHPLLDAIEQFKTYEAVKKKIKA
jgi:hypothetical protein